MFLFLARHAWAGHFGDAGWTDDSLRELTPEGIDRYRRVVRCLAERGFAPGRVATSSYARCRQTAEIIAEETLAAPVVEELAALAPGADLHALLDWSAASPGQDLCWVGHNPDVEWLTGALIGDRGAGVRFAKGAIAAVRFDAAIAPGAGQLYWHATAKSLGID
ncbi:MAG: histidine phosphatase family protein [Planctomycetota bacterium]